jgi:hypothetical protein
MHGGKEVGTVEREGGREEGRERLGEERERAEERERESESESESESERERERDLIWAAVGTAGRSRCPRSSISWISLTDKSY